MSLGENSIQGGREVRRKGGTTGLLCQRVPSPVSHGSCPSRCCFEETPVVPAPWLLFSVISRSPIRSSFYL